MSDNTDNTELSNANAFRILLHCVFLITYIDSERVHTVDDMKPFITK